jgi:HD-GYP domain-containing protein (c-di-GMP phosphodiesterase class II)
MPHTEACRIILDGKNTNFDGRVVDAFENIHEKLAEVACKRN